MSVRLKPFVIGLLVFASFVMVSVGCFLINSAVGFIISGILLFLICALIIYEESLKNSDERERDK